jgi:hypothetical protein
MTTEAVSNEVPNHCDMATELVQGRSKISSEHNLGDLMATDITAERLDMEIEQEDYWEPNWTKPLLEMIAKCHTEGSRNNGRTAY